MKIYIVPDIYDLKKTKYLRELASIAKPKIHTIIEDPKEADIILITYAHLRDSSLNRFLDEYLDKCYAISTVANPLFVLAGLYTSGNKSFWFLHKRLIRGCPYIYSLYQGNPNRNQFVDFDQDIKLDKKYLFSFVGASTSWVRKRLFRLKFQRSDILVHCTNNYNHWNPGQANVEQTQKTYVDVIKHSKFVLCPRGIGWGSIRLFEVMKLGVAPIIISDKWLPPMGPDWESFALFIKQSDLKNLVEIVESYADEYEERGHLARKAWEEYFSDSVVFNNCIEAIEDIKQNRIGILDRWLFYSYPILKAIHNFKIAFREFMKNIILKTLSKFKFKFAYQLRND
ncbi:MAG: exostosin family protein [Cyanobacteria bacterium P01_G01_bin.39]